MIATTARVIMASLIMAVVVGGSLVILPAIVMAVGGGRPDPLCGRACHDPGVTEPPGITLIGGE